MRRALVATLLAAAVGGGLAGPASSAGVAADAVAARPSATGTVEMVVVPSLDLAEMATRGAVGLLVPGSGETVSRQGALSALVRGRATHALVGGVTEGTVLATPSARPGTRATVYVVLPSAGRSSNTRRYPVAVVGAGYRGLLESTSTRIPGLVSVADIAPTVVALREGREPQLGWRAHDDPVGAAAALDRRLDRASAPRDAVTIALVVTALALTLTCLLTRWAVAGRATAAAPLCALAVSLGLSALGLTSPALAIGLAFGVTVPLALLVAWRGHVAGALLGGLVAAYLGLLVASPGTAALAVIGPHPESGGRFFGVTNLIETLLLVGTVAVVAAAPAAPAIALAALTLVTVGWSEAGADGGGILVLGAAYLVVALLRRYGRLGVRELALGGVVVVAGGAALVLLDRLTGGSSHVTRAVGDGPGSLVSDLGRRLDLSWQAATGNAHTLAICLVAVVGIVLVTWLLPRTVAGTAILAGLIVSLLVNDSPADVLVTSAIGVGGLAAAARAAREDAGLRTAAV